MAAQNFTNTSNQIRSKCRMDWLQDEAIKKASSGAIKPGYLIDLDPTGTVIPHATSGGFAERLIAIEDRHQGRTINDAYADGDIVFHHIAEPGDELLIVLKGGSAAVVIGDYLMSNGDGTFIKQTSTNARLFRAKAALDISGGSDTLILARAV
jgi:hypothetical protein